MASRPAGAAKTHSARASKQLGELVLIIVRSLLWVGFTATGTALNMWAAILLLLLLNPVNLWGYLAAGFGAALAGSVDGGITGFGQVMALRWWLDGAASLGSFLSTVLASSSALAAGVVAGWWAHTQAGDLAGVLSGVVAYGCVFGLMQRPMLDYMAPRSILWVPVNVAASIVGAVALFAAYEASGSRRDMLQFRYAGLVYSLTVGIAFLRMTRETRKAMAAGRTGHDMLIEESGVDAGSARSVRHEAAHPALLEIHEHRVYRVYQASQDPNTLQSGTAYGPRVIADPSRFNSEDGENEPEIIDATYRVIP